MSQIDGRIKPKFPSTKAATAAQNMEDFGKLFYEVIVFLTCAERQSFLLMGRTLSRLVVGRFLLRTVSAWAVEVPDTAVACPWLVDPCQRRRVCPFWGSRPGLMMQTRICVYSGAF